MALESLPHRDICFLPKLIVVISSTSNVERARNVRVLAPMLMGPPFKKKRRPEVDLWMYTKAVDVARRLFVVLCGIRRTCREDRPRLSLCYHGCVEPLELAVSLCVGVGACGV